MNEPKPCPRCGQSMRQTRRGATLKKRGPAYICVNDEALTWKDGDGKYHRTADGVHGSSVRVWEVGELETK